MVLLIFGGAALQQFSAAALPVIVSSNQRDAFPVAANKYRIDISNRRWVDSVYVLFCPVYLPTAIIIDCILPRIDKHWTPVRISH